MENVPIGTPSPSQNMDAFSMQQALLPEETYNMGQHPPMTTSSMCFQNTSMKAPVARPLTLERRSSSLEAEPSPTSGIFSPATTNSPFSHHVPSPLAQGPSMTPTQQGPSMTPTHPGHSMTPGSSMTPTRQGSSMTPKQQGSSMTPTHQGPSMTPGSSMTPTRQ